MPPELAGFSIIAELPDAPSHRSFDALADGHPDPVRLLVFNDELSRRAEFRRAFKTDRSVLMMLQHQAIPRVLGTHELNGALLLWTQQPEGRSLASWLAAGRDFSADDVIEIGWQICSALQHVHNVGFSHGGLSVDCVLLTESLQVTVTAFGLHRWLRAAAVDSSGAVDGRVAITVSALASQADVEQDLTDLARLLNQLLPGVERPATASDGERPPSRMLLDRLLQRVLQPADSAHRPGSAREFQGRLGELLIGSADESLPLVDEREDTLGTRRSIVVELFDTQTADARDRDITATPASPAWRTQILPIVIIVVVIAALLVIAGWLWSAAKAAGA